MVTAACVSESPQFLMQTRADGHYNFLRTVGGYEYVPLITEEADTVAELGIMMLRPGRPGAILWTLPSR